YASYASKPPLNTLDPAALRAYVDHAFRERGDGTLQLKCRPEIESQIYAVGPENGAWNLLHAVDATVTVASGAATNAMLPELGGDVLRLRGDDRERVEDVGRDELAHLDPLALLRERVELRLQVAPAVQVEHAAVRGRGAVERDLLLHRGLGRLHLLVVRS